MAARIAATVSFTIPISANAAAVGCVRAAADGAGAWAAVVLPPLCGGKAAGDARGVALLGVAR